MADIVELALDRFTDFTLFERLATEVLTLEGFNNIRPVGGVYDDGVDAEIVKYFEDGEKQKTVFQYTLQENLSSKISNTILKLKDKGISFTQLIFVTKNQINNIGKLRTDARKNHKVNIDIYEKETFIKHLATGGIFSRYFPNMQSQIDSLSTNNSAFYSSDSQDVLEKSLLRCSLLFTFNSGIDGTRKDIFDQTILGIITSANDSVSNKEISTIFQSKFCRTISENEIDASISRLKKNGYVIYSDKIVKPTPATLEKLENNLSRINASTNALIDDIIAKVVVACKVKIDRVTESLLTNNIKKSFSSFFCLYGIEYSENVTLSGKKYGFSNNTDLIAIASKGLKKQLGEQLVYYIGETLKEPTEPQAEILANWAKAYLAVQIMGLDPKLSNLQATKLKDKTFVIDTDFLLYCIVPGTSLNQIYLKIVNELLGQRCKIYIPTEVV